MLRRHPFLVALSTLLLLTALAVATMVLTFDLNRYRGTVQDKITAAIGRPVKLGDAQLSLRHGLAFTFSAIDIAEVADASWSLTAESLLTKLKVAPLLHGKIEFAEIVLLSPHLHLTVRQNTPPPAGNLPPWEDFNIRRLSIRDGSVSIDDQRESAYPLPLEFEKVNLRLTNFTSGQRTRLQLTAQLRQSGAPAELAITGEIVPVSDLRQSPLNLALTLGSLDAAALSPYLPALDSLAGSLALKLNLTGKPATGLQIGGEILGSELTAAMPDWYQKPLTIKKLRLAGAWTQEEGSNRLTELMLNLDELAASGDLLWRGEKENLWVEGTLTTPSQSVAKLLRILPDHGPLTEIKKQLAGAGSWQLENLHYAGRGKDFAPENLSLQGTFTVQNLKLKNPDPRLGALSLTGRFVQDRLEVTGDLDFIGAPLRFAGTVAPPFSAPDVNLKAEGIFSSARLLAALATPKDEKLGVTGPLPLSCTATGPLSNLRFTLAAKLNEVAIAWEEPPQKPVTLAGALTLAGTLTPDRLTVDRARLHMDSLDLRGKGTFARKGDQPFSLAVEFAGLDLEKLQPQFTFIEKIAGTGLLDGNYEIAGKAGRINSRRGSLRLRNVGMHLTSLIAPIGKINGRVRLHAEQFDIDQMTASLGSSPLTITGTLRGPEDFQAILNVHGQSIRADELIFASGQWLRDVNGTLRIDRQGIAFAPVTVRMDRGTEASVRGEVTFAPPAVNLDIAAARGNIDEVIALWQEPTGMEASEQAAPTGAEQSPEHPVKVSIHASVGEGTLGELHFQQAEGSIIYEEGLLEIFPLRFQVGPGTCQGRVAVEFGDEGARLKTSGHLENVDAAAIYQELLKRRGLITGTLHGDFYLEGIIGKEFLKTSMGGFSIETRRGVLHKFPVLGKIFSLLNVSQIFALQLPDMAKDGMPFQKLTGNFSLQEGILHTEDLFIKSPAMNLSLIGEVNLPEEKIDMVMGIKPLRTVDRIVTKIPIAGWILTGEEKALITLHFKIHGHLDQVEVNAVPITFFSEKIFGILRRVLNLPSKMVDNIGEKVNE